MRGTLPGGGHEIDNVGLIPTYAGNTFTVPAGKVVSGAHPHVCGEHIGQISVSGDVKGSSPRMRGTLLGIGLTLVLCGLIPTYAGNTNET